MAQEPTAWVSYKWRIINATIGTRPAYAKLLSCLRQGKLPSEGVWWLAAIYARSRGTTLHALLEPKWAGTYSNLKRKKQTAVHRAIRRKVQLIKERNKGSNDRRTQDR